MFSALILDISKASDEVWHQGLLYKMALLGIENEFTILMNNIIIDRIYQLKIKNLTLTTKTISAGFPIVLSPTIYNINNLCRREGNNF